MIFFILFISVSTVLLNFALFCSHHLYSHFSDYLSLFQFLLSRYIPPLISLNWVIYLFISSQSLLFCSLLICSILYCSILIYSNLICSILFCSHCLHCHVSLCLYLFLIFFISFNINLITLLPSLYLFYFIFHHHFFPLLCILESRSCIHRF